MYLITFGIALVLLHFSEKTERKAVKRALVAMALLLPSCLAGVRDFTIGWDVLLYGKGWFEKSCEYNSLILFLEKANEYSIGIGYAAINYCVSRVTKNFHIFLFVYQLIQLCIVYYTIKPLKKEISIVFAFFVYFFSYYNLSLNILRQIMAVMIVFFSYRYILKRKPIRFVLTIAIAYTFHSTAIIGLVLYPINWALNNKSLKMLSKIAIIVGGAGVSVGYQALLTVFAKVGVLSIERYSHYVAETEVGGRYIRLLYWLIIIILILWKGRKCIEYNNKSLTLEMYMTMSGIFSLIAFLGGLGIVRIAYYFDVFQILFLPILVQKLPFTLEKKKTKGSYLVIGAIIVTFWLFNYIIRNGGNTYPYVFMRN